MARRAQEEEDETDEEEEVPVACSYTPFDELGVRVTKSNEYCWLCVFAFRKPTSSSAEPGMAELYSAYMNNRDQMTRAALCALLEKTYMNHIWQPKYDSGDTAAHMVTAAQIERHLSTHTQDVTQLLLNRMHDQIVDSDVLKGMTFAQTPGSDTYVVSAPIIAMRIKRDDQFLKYLGMLQSLKKT